MKITVARQEFLDALSAAVQLASARTPKPILACVRLATDDERLVVSSTDGEAALRISVPTLTVKRAGVAVVQADRLLNIVRELGDVEVHLDVDDRQCIIQGEGSEFKIFTAPPDDFPPTPSFSEDPDFTMDGRELRRMVAMTAYAAARETSRYAINGVLWEKRGKKLFMVATDGRRLARAGGSILESSTKDFEAIVPSKTLQVFERVFAPPRGEDVWKVDIKLTPHQVLLRTDDRVLTSVLVEGHFPDYQKVIPEGNDKRARIARDELLSAVRRAALLTTDESRAVKLALSGDRLVITSQAPEQGDARIELPIEYDGADVQIGFNPTFLGDALKSTSYDQVTLELSESFRPGVLSGDDKAAFLYVVMPVSL